MKRFFLLGLAALGLIALAPNQSNAVSVYIGPSYPYYRPYYYGYYHHWHRWHHRHHWRHWHYYHPYWY
jgi:hypothetical protein